MGNQLGFEKVDEPQQSAPSPLLTDTCPLTEVVSLVISFLSDVLIDSHKVVPHVVVQHLLAMLTVHQLSLVASTCSALREAVAEFLRHELVTLDLDDLVANFCEEHGKMLTLAERRSMSRYRVENVEEIGIAERYRRVSAGRRWKKHFGQHLRRVSCASSAVWIPHKDNLEYFRIKADEELGREVVELKTVCWLEVVHVMEGVGVGIWEVSLRLNLTDGFFWPHQEHYMAVWCAQNFGANAFNLILKRAH